MQADFDHVFFISTSFTHSELFFWPDKSISFRGAEYGWQFFLMIHRFNPAAAGRALILRSLLRYNNVHFMPRQLAARWLINSSNWLILLVGGSHPQRDR